MLVDSSAVQGYYWLPLSGWLSTHVRASSSPPCQVGLTSGAGLSEAAAGAFGQRHVENRGECSATSIRASAWGRDGRAAAPPSGGAIAANRRRQGTATSRPPRSRRLRVDASRTLALYTLSQARQLYIGLTGLGVRADHELALSRRLHPTGRAAAVARGRPPASRGGGRSLEQPGQATR